ncbi:Hypothetical_protein [Hexamita inflata]|uniref:Hypothetical_protein n=1 Tax=Hexamita inflata TaxID=28002 RepID=A0AA86PV34_9EUKA|nr:Hypothetical protein HINF_LOCUS33163 [Hexamita inflata]
MHLWSHLRISSQISQLLGHLGMNSCLTSQGKHLKKNLNVKWKQFKQAEHVIQHQKLWKCASCLEITDQNAVSAHQMFQHIAKHSKKDKIHIPIPVNNDLTYEKSITFFSCQNCADFHWLQTTKELESHLNVRARQGTRTRHNHQDPSFKVQYLSYEDAQMFWNVEYNTNPANIVPTQPQNQEVVQQDEQMEVQQNSNI